MSISKAKFSEYIQQFRLKELFIDLGWDNENARVPPIIIDTAIFSPQVIADKNGFKIITCSSPQLAAYPIRFQAANKIKPLFHESIIIFTDEAKTKQAWLYSYKNGTATKKVQVEWNKNQDTERLYQRAAGLIFDITEQDTITIVDVTDRVQSNFAINAEKVTKKFYDAFKKQHTALLNFITGIEATVDREWYASIMLNRLMFCYFMQRKGFLNHDRDYLRTKLNESKQKLGEGQFYSFYRNFLLKLFQQGFGTYNHNSEVVEMIGEIPYLNGGLFDLHEIEQGYPNIDISDEAFEHIFDLFDEFEWHLDTRDCATGKEISPDVLGYIFEKYINDRAAMGAYYTQEDITGYIGRSTILPYLLESVKKTCPGAFASDGTAWKILQKSGDTYIFDSVKHGIKDENGETIPLPDNIAIGVDTTAPNLLERRKGWNTPAPGDYALATETWREVVDRRNRYDSVLSKIQNGEINDISDFITYNLDIVSFVSDILDTIEDPQFIKAFYMSLEKITILDPTCGSGAFLFAALNILEPLYNSCLSRMVDYLGHDYKGSLERGVRRYFDEKLEHMENEIHPNRNYFIYKSIILNNLYGVDIMREAVETAKLRLFLKLVSTAEPNYHKENIGIEPLPDIDFNIKSGNTLIGYANDHEIDDALDFNIFSGQFKSETKDAMYKLAKATAHFKELQLGEGDYTADEFKTEKTKLSKLQTELKQTLDKVLKTQHYPSVKKAAWETNYLPFHWVAEFYSIIVENGGFSVIIGNPPYVEYSKVKNTYTLKNYETLACGNLYAFVIEKSINLKSRSAYVSLIIPSASVCTPRMSRLLQFTQDHFENMWVSVYDERPSKLFDGVDQQLSIHIYCNSQISAKAMYITQMMHWRNQFRSELFSLVEYQNLVFSKRYAGVMPKLKCNLELEIMNKITSISGNSLNSIDEIKDEKIYYRNAGGRYWRLVKGSPSHFFSTSGANISTTEKVLLVGKKSKSILIALFSSNLFYWYWRVISNCRHLTNRELESFVIPSFAFENEVNTIAEKLSNEYELGLRDNSTRQITVNKSSGTIEQDNYHVQKSKPIIDEIDKVLAKHYGFTDEELDYIINYDIKYRMGIGGGAADDE